MDCFRQQVTAPRQPDFSDPFPTTLTLDDFAFVQTPLDELRQSPSLGVVLSAKSLPRRGHDKLS